MLVASARSLVLDHHRVPYEVRPDGSSTFAIGASGESRRLTWPRLEGRGLPLRRFDVDAVRAFGPLDAARGLIDESGWQRDVPVTGTDGGVLAHVLRAEDGSIHLPFDPDASALTLLAERYLGHGAGLLRSLARRAYYGARPLLPRELQLALRRRFRRVQERATFPAWPAESALHDLYDYVLARASEISPFPVPSVSPWPEGHAWALVVTHDVERAAGYAFVKELADLERRVGVRSAWFFVPERDYRVAEDVLAGLRADGFEIGLHGLRHDGRDLEPATFGKRLPEMRRYVDAWGVAGFRSPATHRRWELMPRIGLDYDSSYSDVARYEPQPGGSCSLWPFFISDLVELPITMPMDHTLFEILGERDERLWIEKATWLRDHGGMAMLITHPDYLRETSRLSAYRRFLEWAVTDETCWRALPAEVSAWWRARSRTSVIRRNGGWSLEGPAADRAVIRLA